MKATIELTLKPFTVPNYVIAEPPKAPGEQPDGSFPLSMIDAATLERMCDDFRSAVFEKAGKSPPPQVACKVPPDVSRMVDRFLGWPLPKTFAPDAGITFTPPMHPHSWPCGTNLFDASQARAMFEHAVK